MINFSMILLDIPNKFWDDNFMHMIDGIQIQLGQGEFIGIAKEVAAILSLMYLSVKAYAMIVGEGRLDIMPLFRPFIVTLVIVNFGLYADIVGGVGKAAAEQEKGIFQANSNHMDDLMATKDSLSNTFWARVIDSSANIRGQMTSDANAFTDVIDENMNSNFITQGISKAASHASNAITSYITLYEQLAWAKLSMWLQGLIETIVLSIFKGVGYCLFFIQLILMHILLILGPLSFAFSIIGAFRDSWVQWTARYVAVSFYSAIGMIVMNMAILIISYGIKQENSRMDQILSKAMGPDFYKTVMQVDNFLGYLLIGLLVAIGGIISVPLVSGWILSGGDTGQAMHGTAIGSAKKGVGAATGVVSGRINSIRNAVKS